VAATSYQRGANCERALARRIGGQRVGNRGAATLDVVTPYLAVESKCRKVLPKWLLEALRGAVTKAGPEQLPMVVLHLLGQRHDNDVVLLRLCDFEAYFGALAPQEEEEPLD